MSSLFDEDEKYPAKRLAHVFFLLGLVSSISFVLLLIVGGSSLLFVTPGHAIRVYWPGFLWLIFSLALTFFSFNAIRKQRRRRKNDS